MCRLPPAQDALRWATTVQLQLVQTQLAQFTLCQPKPNTLADLVWNESDVAKTELKHHESSPNNIQHQIRESPHCSSAWAPHALRRTQQSRLAINSNHTVVSHYHRRMPHHSCSSNKLWSVTCGCGVLLLRDALCLTHDLTHTLLVLLISGARLDLGAGPRLPTPHAVSAHGHTPNQHHFCECSSFSSMRHECGGWSGRFHHSCRSHHSSRFHHSVVWSTHSRSLRHTHCLLLSVHKYRQDNSILLVSSTAQQIDWSLWRFQACSLGQTSPRSQESSCQDRSGSPSHTRASSAPATASREALFLAIRESEPPLLQVFPLFCVSCPSTSRTPENCSPLSSTRSNSLLRLSVASGTSAFTGVTCSVVSLTYLAVSLTATLLRILVNIVVLLPTTIRRLPSSHSRRIDRVIPQSPSTSKWRFARHWFSTPGTISPDQQRAWRLYILAELFRFNPQTGLFHRSWDRFLVHVDLLLGFARVHHLHVLRARSNRDTNRLPHLCDNSDVELLSSERPARFSTRFASVIMWALPDDHVTLAPGIRSRSAFTSSQHLPSFNLRSVGGSAHTPLSSQSWRNADNVSHDSGWRVRHFDTILLIVNLCVRVHGVLM